MCEALDRIVVCVQEFSQGIDRCSNASTFNRADVQDAYNRLSRLRDRYRYEKGNHDLDEVEEQALRKVFEEDPFVEGMLDGRQIGEHVKIKEPVIRLMTNSPIPLVAETSAGSFFAAHVSAVYDTQGRVYFVDHVKQLREAEKRIKSAISRSTDPT